MANTKSTTERKVKEILANLHNSNPVDWIYTVVLSRFDNPITKKTIEKNYGKWFKEYLEGK